MGQPVLTDAIPIEPIGPFRSKLTIPGSKSLTNRALLLAALAQGESVIHQPLFADDTSHMLNALRALGLDPIQEQGDRSIRLTGCAGQTPGAPKETTLALGNAGTAYRFLTAACCLGSRGCGKYQLDGNERMQDRPIAQLVDALHQIGGQVQYLGKTGYPPLQVTSSGLTGGDIQMPPTLSSQYISALLQVAPYCRQGLTIRFRGPMTSKPYVQMTLGLMARFGAEIQADPQLTMIQIKPGQYRGIEYTVEPDASNASYFLAAAAIIPGSTCTIEGLGRNSLQGDVGFADVLHQMGAGLVFDQDSITVISPPQDQMLQGIDIDLNAMPDMAQTLAVVALFAQGQTTIRNIGNLRIKETDRLEALRIELTKLGAQVRIDGDDLTIDPPPHNQITPAAIDTYDDHRMAMSFAVVGLRAKGIVINDRACVNKTFPRFFEYLAQLS